MPHGGDRGGPGRFPPVAAGRRKFHGLRGQSANLSHHVWARVRTAPASLAILLAVIAGVVLVPVFGDDYALQVGATVAIYAIAVIGLNVLVGYARQISFGHNAFVAVGAFTSAVLTTRYRIEPAAAMAAGCALTLIVALVVSYPILRLKEHYFAMATLALGLGTYSLAVNLQSVTGGFAGIAAIPYFHLFGLVFSDPRNFYGLAWTIAAAVLALVAFLARSRFGRSLRTTGLDEDVAQTLGISPHGYKVAAFCLSAIFASIAGSLMAHLITFISPESFSLELTINLFVVLFIGGLANPLGSVVGAALLIVAPQMLGFLKDYEPVAFGALLLVILLIRPRGLLEAGH